MKRALIAASVYSLALMILGFALGTLRVFVVAPHIGALNATLLELPFMLIAAFLVCRYSIRRCQVPNALAARSLMAVWFLSLLLGFETLAGLILFGRTLIEQSVAMTAPEALAGLAAQVIAAMLPMIIDRKTQR